MAPALAALAGLCVCAARADAPVRGVNYTAFACNGRLIMTFDGSGSYSLQMQNGEEWEDVTLIGKTGGYFISQEQSLNGESVWRVALMAEPYEWDVFTVDARNPVTVGATVWDNCEANPYGYLTHANPYAVDGDTDSVYHIGQNGIGEDQSIYADFKVPKRLCSGALIGRVDFPARIGAGVFEGANERDFSDAVQLAEVPAEAGHNRYNFFEFTSTNYYRYARLRPTGNGVGDGWLNIAECEICALPGGPTMSVDGITVSDGRVDAVELGFSNIVDESVYVAWASEALDGTTTNVWPNIYKAQDLASGVTDYTLVELPPDLGGSAKYFMIFLIASSGSAVSMSETIAWDGAQYPAFDGRIAIARYSDGDTIRVSGTMLSAGTGSATVAIEMSYDSDFSSVFEWSATCDASGLSYLAYMQDFDPSSPKYLRPGAAVYLRARATDSNGHVVRSEPQSFTIGANFNGGPVPWSAPFAINGRLTIPLAEGHTSYIVQKYDEAQGVWNTVADVGSHNAYTYSPDQSLRGSSVWRVAYVPTYPGQSEPNFWREFTVDARNPASGTILSVGGVWEGSGCVPEYAFDGYNFSFYEPHASSWATDKLWIGLDLGSEKKISSIAFIPREGDAYRCEGAKLQVADNEAFTNAVDLYTVPAYRNYEFYLIELDEPVIARYARIWKPTEWFNIGEFEVCTKMSGLIIYLK
ncbi:MAG: discoidin domain-containing protein [Kiritimatiellae bacterium]|nr:discoidin domain-containing protein [Kiritimatiellia bacterium]